MKQIRIKKADLELDIYRFYPMDRFLELLDLKKLTLVKPKLWSDPMETIIFESSFNFTGERSSSLEYKDNYFAQCWTLKHESFALWNEYAPLQNGVRVKTKLGKLISQLKLHSNQKEDTWFVGKVHYLSLKSIKSWIGNNMPYVNVISMPNIHFGQVHSLFIKLNQYSHESEVRIVFNSHGDKEINQIDIYQQLHIEPLKLFDRLLLDPRMPENIYKIFRAELIERGFDSKQVIRSGLLDERRLRKELRSI
jgi:hypothetical protein